MDSRRHIAAEDDYREALSRIVEAATGAPFPQEPFPAIITGMAVPQYPRRPYANQPLQTPYPLCVDPPGLNDCAASDTMDSHGFYANTLLPCNVWPVRYRWRSDALHLDSELCGYRQDWTGAWHPWRQAMYAVNTMHAVTGAQDIKLDYPYLRPGTPVIMAFGRIGAVSGNTPPLGFYFHHATDPLHGWRMCPAEATPPVYVCCEVWTGIELMWFCATVVECLGAGGIGQPIPDNRCEPPCS